MALRGASNMITPPGLTAVNEKNILVTEKASKPIVGMWRVGSCASWSNESEEHISPSNIKLRTEKGAIDAHIVVTSFARDDRPCVDVSSTTGSVTVRLTRTENSRFDLHAGSNSGTITVYLPTDFHGVIDFSRYLTYQLLNTLLFLWFTAENFFVFTLSLGLRDPTDADPAPYPHYGFGIGRRTLLTPAPWAFAILFLVHVLFSGSIAFVQWTERGKEIIIRGLTWRWSALMFASIMWTAAWVRQKYVLAWFASIVVSLLAAHAYLAIKASSMKEFRVVSGFNWREEVFVYLPFALYDGWALLIFVISTFAAFAPNAIYSGLGTKIAAIWLLTLLVGTAHGHAFFTPGGNIPGNVAITWGIFAIFAEQAEPSVKWAALILGIISVFAVARSVYVLAEDIRTGIGGGAVRLPPDEEGAPANGANGHNDSA
ncbi:unnamed protein product [Rhizoctonia solani]|uniref:DUF7330 domain-containing protein n=1 Tax=Rhizoctonia solani TaxID=456999 RepID=A0A8H3I177_9AGAM|nr:unnamed protein product [Rhizoctonia solani]